MSLPLRYVDGPQDGPVISVDGAFDAPGLNLSHWPGNKTPEPLKHELSTGIALGFVSLPESEQQALAGGATAVVNNHYDTDGVLSLFAITHPELALAHSSRLIEWARAGDFFWATSTDAFCADFATQAYANPAVSPVAHDLQGLGELERYRVATLAVHERIHDWLAGEWGPDEALFAGALARYRSDRARLAAVTEVPLVHLDLVVWDLAAGQQPGRHALMSAAPFDRILTFAHAPAGTLTRFWISTLSWFDLPDKSPLRRPDLPKLVARLNSLEPERGADHRWHCHPSESPSPELWFGKPKAPFFLPHMDEYLAPSQIHPATIKSEIMEALRDAWEFDNEDETSDLEDIYKV